jgi:Tol biopolymer transport system component
VLASCAADLGASTASTLPRAEETAGGALSATVHARDLARVTQDDAPLDHTAVSEDLQHPTVAVSPDGRTLLVPSATRDAIVAVDAATGARRVALRAPSGSVSLRSPAWLPDGQGFLLVYTLSVGRSAVTRIARRRLDDADPTAVEILSTALSAPSIASIAVAPDGERLALSTECCIGGAVGIARRDAPEVALLAAGEAPAWSADGSFLAFSGTSSAVDSHVLYVERLGAPSHPRAALTQPSEASHCPVFSPDGRSLAFARVVGLASQGERSITVTRLFVVGVEGGAPVQLTAGNVTVGCASWSRDNWLYFPVHGGEGPYGQRAIWRLRPVLP